MKVEVICSWCGRPMGSKECNCPGQSGTVPLISHGICPECLDREMASLKAMNNNTHK